MTQALNLEIPDAFLDAFAAAARAAFRGPEKVLADYLTGMAGTLGAIMQFVEVAGTVMPGPGGPLAAGQARGAISAAVRQVADRAGLLSMQTYMLMNAVDAALEGRVMAPRDVAPSGGVPVAFGADAPDVGFIASLSIHIDRARTAGHTREVAREKALEFAAEVTGPTVDDEHGRETWSSMTHRLIDAILDHVYDDE